MGKLKVKSTVPNTASLLIPTVKIYSTSKSKGAVPTNLTSFQAESGEDPRIPLKSDLLATNSGMLITTLKSETVIEHPGHMSYHNHS